jgi:hypothetical protein
MPAKVDRCVQDLLKDPKFRPNQKKETRESSAWAICQAAQKNKKKKNSEIDYYSTLFDLPESIGISIDENGNFELTDLEETEGIEDEVFEEVEDEPNYDLYYDENGMDDESPKGFSILSEIILDKQFKKNANEEKPEVDNEEEHITASTRLELLRSGIWNHPWYGAIAFDKKYFMNCVQNFVNDVLHRDISFDAQHMPWFGAVAWVTKLSVRRRKFFDNKSRWVLTADVEFTKDGEDMIRQKRFKYFSSEVHDNYREQEINGDDNDNSMKEYGPTLMGGGVTNRPYISGMLAVELSEDGFGFNNTEPGVDDSGTKRFAEVGDEEVDDKQLEELIVKLDKIIKEEGTNLTAEKKTRPTDSELPDAAFALVKKDKMGKVVKRSLSHHKPSKSPTEFSVDIERLRNALERIDQVKGFTPAEISKAKLHLTAHANELLKTRKENKKEKAAQAAETTTNKGVDNMDFEQMIKDVQVKLDALEDKDSDLAKAFSEQIATLQTAKEKAEADQKKFADEQFKKFEEQQQKIEEQQKALDDQKKKFDEMEERWAVADEERRLAKIQLFCETLEKEDHLPATIEVVKKYMFADTNSMTIKLSEGEGEEKTEINYNLEKMFKEILDTIPKDRRVKLSEKLKGEGTDTPETKTTTVQLSDVDEPVDVMEDKRRHRALKRAGFKVKGADDVQ